jgi:hypothetical protein
MSGCKHLKVLRNMNQKHKKQVIIKERKVRKAEDQKQLNFLALDQRQRKE